MSPETITVTLSNGTVSVSQPTLNVLFGHSPRITWEPANANYQVVFVGFMDAVGNGHPIEIPQAGSQHGTISTVDVNNNRTGQPQRFKYLVWVKQGNVVYASEDPEIVNDPQIGRTGTPS